MPLSVDSGFAFAAHKLDNLRRFYERSTRQIIYVQRANDESRAFHYIAADAGSLSMKTSPEWFNVLHHSR